VTGPVLSAGAAAALLARTEELPPAPFGDAVGDLDAVRADLDALGLPPGALVLLGMSNSLAFLTCWFAVVLSGGVPLAVSPATPTARLVRLAELLDARALLTARAELGAQPLRRTARVGPVRALVLPADGPSPYRPGQALLLTSGTSGMYTACVHEVTSLLRNARRHAAAVRLTGADTVLVNLPMYYSYAVVAQALAALETGARLVVSGPPFVPSAYRAALTARGVTSSSITPTIARQLLATDDRLPAGLRMLGVGGDRLAAEEVGGLLRRHAGELYVTYGLTEAGPRVSTLDAHAEPAHRHASVGRPMAGVRTHLRPAPDAPAGVGELVVESDTVLVRKVGPVRRQPLLAPGRIATADLFHIDGDGYHFFRSRLSDFATINGEKVSFDSVRQAVTGIPGVLRCVPRVDAGHFDLTVEVASPQITEASVRSRLNALLARSERPRDIEIVLGDATAFRK
jgi:acyl-CoA synthetase (AMP-forming)/AMP-acid ligase II